MTDTDTEFDTSSGMKIPRFHGRRGEDYGLWRHRLRAACRVKGVWRVVDSLSDSTTSTESTAGPSTSSVRDQVKREKASGIIISSLGDAPLRVVMDVDDDPVQMLKLLDSRYASNRTVSRIAVQTQLFRLSYTGQNMSTYIDQYTTLFSQLERMGKDAAIPETHKAPMLLASIDQSCSLESTAAAIRTKNCDDLTWDYVATTLIDEFNAKVSLGSGCGAIGKGRDRRRKKKKGISSAKPKLSDDGDDSEDNSDLESTVRAFTVALKSANYVRTDGSRTHHCEFCDKDGHTEDRCYLNPDNPNNKLPPKVRQMLSKSSKKGTATAAIGTTAKGTSNGPRLEITGATVERTTIQPPDDHNTYADSGATVHCFHSNMCFVPGSLIACDTRTVMLADKTSVTAHVSGEVILPFEHANIRLKDVLHIPSMGYNLVSTGRLADNGIESHFRRNDVCLTLETDAFYVGSGTRDQSSRMYMLPHPQSHSSWEEQAFVATSVQKDKQTELWHQRLAHINVRDLLEVHKHATGIPKLVKMDDVCRACRMGKAHKLPFPGHFQHADAVGDLVHSDIVGPLVPSFPDNFRYVSTFLDDHSRYVMIACMTRRSLLGLAFEKASAKLLQIGGATISKIHSDGAKEYVALQKDLGGVVGDNSFSPPHTPELNAIAERINRTMVEAARSSLLQASLPGCLWPFALKHVIYVRNRVPHSSVGATSYGIVTGEKPDMKHIRVFGCAAYVLRLPRGSKFESCALEGVYLETLEHGIYRVLVMEEENLPRVIESRHVTFDETTFPGASALHKYEQEESEDDSYTTDIEGSEVSFNSSVSISDQGDTPDNEFIHVDDSNTTSDVTSNLPPESPRYPSRDRRKPQQWYMATSAQCNDQVNVTTSDEPTLREAMSATPEERDVWLSAVDDEFRSLDSKAAWVPDPSPGAQPLPTHAILKIKRKSDGTVERFKARVVAGGNFQTYGEDYMETYAPVVSFTLVRIFLYLVLCLNMVVAQLDVKTAFLNGDLAEHVWVMSPRGIPGRESRCYKLLKAMYGLKQAHLSWHTKLVGDLNQMGYKELPSAPCVFRRVHASGITSYILVYVDDILVLATTLLELNGIVEELKALYELRLADKVDLFLGVQLGWELSSDGNLESLKLSQPLYTESILRRFGLQTSKPACTPMVESFFTGLSAEQDRTVVHVELFQQMIGSLLYLALRTRLDILAPVLILARFQKSPTSYCHRGAKRVLRYLRGTSDYGIKYSAGSMDLQAYVDADSA